MLFGFLGSFGAWMPSMIRMDAFVLRLKRWDNLGNTGGNLHPDNF